MAIYAELEDGRRLEFPDGTNPQVVQATVKRLIASAPPKDTGPTEGMGQAALIAAGRGTDKIVQGVRQGYNWLTGDQKTLDKMAGDEAEKDRAYKPLQDKHPFTTAVGEMAPGIAAGFLTGGTTMLGGAASTAIPSLLAYGSAEERLKRGATDAVGGAVGAKAGQLLARALKPAGVGAAGVSDDALAAAERIGYKPTAAQITQNPGMMAVENYLLRTPGSSGAMQRVAQANQTAVNKTAAGAMGQNADDLGEAVFSSAKQRIGGEFDRLGQITKPDLQGGFLNTLAKVDADNLARGSFASKDIDSLVDKALDLAAKNNLDGKAYKEVRSELASRAQSAFKGGDATTGQAYKSVYMALDDAAKGSLSKADQEAWDVARKEWAAFKTLSKSNVAEGGNASPARVAAAVRQQGPQLRTGGASGPLSDIARIGEAFKGVANPNSGQLAQQMLFSNPLTGIPMMAANRAGAAVYMNPLVQRYLANGLLDVGETGAGLLGQGGAQIGAPAVRGLLGVE